MALGRLSGSIPGHSYHLSPQEISLNCLLEGWTDHLKEKETTVELI